MKKIVTTHGENYIRVWKFRPKSSWKGPVVGNRVIW
jgi:hypothetical protein